MAPSSDNLIHTRISTYEYVPLDGVTRNESRPDYTSSRPSFDPTDRDTSDSPHRRMLFGPDDQDVGDPSNWRMSDDANIHRLGKPAALTRIDGVSTSDSDDPKDVPIEAKPHAAAGAYGHSPDHPRKPHLTDWLWEFAALGFSLACVTAVMILLIVYREKISLRLGVHARHHAEHTGRFSFDLIEDRAHYSSCLVYQSAEMDSHHVFSAPVARCSNL